MPITVDSYTGAIDSILSMPSSGFDRVAQAFSCASASKKLTSSTWLCKSEGGLSLAGRTAVSKLYAIGTGVFGSTAAPVTGQAPLATSDLLDLAGVSGTAGNVVFTFSSANQYVMAAGNYIISLEFGNGDGTHILDAGYNSASVHPGNIIVGHISGDTWPAASSSDAYFVVTGELADVTVNLTGVAAGPVIGIGTVQISGATPVAIGFGEPLRPRRRPKRPAPPVEVIAEELEARAPVAPSAKLALGGLFGTPYIGRGTLDVGLYVVQTAETYPRLGKVETDAVVGLQAPEYRPLVFDGRFAVQQGVELFDYEIMALLNAK